MYNDLMTLAFKGLQLHTTAVQMNVADNILPVFRQDRTPRTCCCAFSGPWRLRIHSPRWCTTEHSGRLLVNSCTHRTSSWSERRIYVKYRNISSTWNFQPAHIKSSQVKFIPILRLKDK